MVLLGRFFDAVPRHAGEESGLAVMVVVFDVRDTGEDRELAAMLIKMLQIACAFVFQPSGLREQKGCVETEVATNEQNSFWRSGLCSAEATREHGIQYGQREADGSGFKEVAAGDGLAEIDVHE